MEPVAATIPSKSPLESRTIVVNAVTLIGLVVAKFYPPMGEWLQQNSDAVIGLVTVLSMYGRQQASKPLDLKNWSFKGVGVKF